ncbi:uncharacterized protein LOC135498830 isoform X2 [Lineus longissimus]
MAAQPQGTRAKGKKRAAPMPATGNQAPRPARRRRNIPAAAGSSDALAMSSGSQDGPSLADNASSTQSVPSVADMFAEMKTMMSTMVTLIAGQHNVRNDGPNVGVGGGINAVAQPHGSVVTMQPGHGLSSTIHPYNPIQSSHSVQPASNLGDPTAASPSMNLHVQQPGNMEHCNATAIHLNGPLLGQVTGQCGTPVGPMVGPRPVTASGRYIPQGVADSLNVLVGGVLSESAKQSYNRAWTIYLNFCTYVLHCDCSLPLSVSDCTLFVAYLYSKNYAPATIASYLSAVCFTMKWHGYPDPSSSFLVKKLLGAAQNLKGSSDIRLPITKPILVRLLAAVPRVFPLRYQQLLVRAMFSTAFHACLRIGEMVPKTCNPLYSSTCIQLGDVTVARGEATISVLRFKSSRTQGPQFIHLASGSAPCPIAALTDYLSLRGTTPGPLFLAPSGAPLLRRDFDRMLKLVLAFCGLDSSRFKGHSFRIGASSEAARQGKSDTQIRLLGRWSSDAFRKYIRIN